MSRQRLASFCCGTGVAVPPGRKDGVPICAANVVQHHLGTFGLISPTKHTCGEH